MSVYFSFAEIGGGYVGAIETLGMRLDSIDKMLTQQYKDYIRVGHNAGDKGKQAKLAFPFSKKNIEKSVP